MNFSSVAYLFPGQGSQHVGMGKELSLAFPAAMNLYSIADEILEFSLSSLSWQGPEGILNDTINTQPALFTHSLAALRVLQDYFPGVHPGAVAGHSMGEISALSATGVINFQDGLRIARLRGEVMKRAGEISPGGMAAVIGLDIPQIEQICRYASGQNEIAQIANDNCPGQVVISGTTVALDRAIKLLQDAGARRVLKLSVSIAAHSPLMLQAQPDYSQAIKTLSMSEPNTLIIGNVNAQPLLTKESIRQDLIDQLIHRVRWTQTVQWMQSIDIRHYIEIGPGTVLSGLVKRIDPSALTFSFGKPEDLDKLITKLGSL